MMVIHQGNLKSDYQIFFLFTFEEITDVFFVFNSMYRSIDRLYTIVMFTRGSGLMFGTFAQFLFKLFFSRGAGGMKETFENSGGEGRGLYFTKMEIPERWGVYLKFPPWWGYGYFLELHNRPFHGFRRHLGWGAKTAKFTVNVWEKLGVWRSIIRERLTFCNFYELQT